MEKTNVFIIHNGNQPYLKLMLAQLESIENECNIVLLGKGASKIKYGEEIEDFLIMANEFEKYYFHLSQQTQAFELICIQRWMIIYEYMKKHGLKGKILHLDSDVLLFEKPDTLFNIYQPFDVTMGLKWSPANTMFRNVEVLGDFCEFVMNLYKNEKDLIKQVYQRECIENKSPNGISDMRLFQMWMTAHPIKYVDTGEICKYCGENYICDVNFNMANGFEMEGKYKKVYKVKDQLYFKSMDNGSLVRVCSLHFQGAAKMEMHKYIDKNVKLPIDYQKWYRKFVVEKKFSALFEKIGIRKILKNILNKFR